MSIFSCLFPLLWRGIKGEVLRPSPQPLSAAEGLSGRQDSVFQPRVHGTPGRDKAVDVCRGRCPAARDAQGAARDRGGQIHRLQYMADFHRAAGAGGGAGAVARVVAWPSDCGSCGRCCTASRGRYPGRPGKSAGNLRVATGLRAVPAANCGKFRAISMC